MTAYKALVRREWRMLRAFFFIAIGLTALWTIGWGWIGRFHSDMPVEAVKFSVMPLIAVILWAFAAGYSTVDEEWKRGTVNMLLALPVRGRVIIGAKLTAFALATAAVVTAIIVGSTLVWIVGGRPYIEVHPAAIPVGVVWLLVISVVTYVLTAMSSLAARSVPRPWGGFVGVIVFVGSLVVIRPVSAVFSWLVQPLQMEPIELCIGLTESWSTCPIPSPVTAPMIVFNAMFAIVLFALSAYLLERRAEV